MANLFWHTYKNLEKEVLNLTDFVFFDDTQTDTYSIKNVELLMRCAIEIESISKELYRQEGGDIDSEGKKSVTKPDGTLEKEYVKYDFDCLKLLDIKWKLSKKQIQIVSSNMFFEKKENIILQPLKDAHKGEQQWQKKYQGIKHDRGNEYKNASIRSLLKALGALYILNLYYRNEIVDIGRTYMGTNKFDNRAGSEVFSVFNYSAILISMSTDMDDTCIEALPDNELDKSIYIIKYDDKSFREMHKNFCLDSEVTQNNFNTSMIISDFLKQNPNYSEKSVNEICMAAGGQSLLMKTVCFTHSMQEKETRTEAILNKHCDIYPHLSRLNDI